MSELRSNAEEEDLQIEYEEKCNEVVELHQELRAAQLEAQRLRLRLQAAGIKSTVVFGARNPTMTPSRFERKSDERLMVTPAPGKDEKVEKKARSDAKDSEDMEMHALPQRDEVNLSSPVACTRSAM
mmetsp:Transcript_85719/g.135371  ORF Transcript_85719/g.135371 Transcript_85719/m.135371 type:complete len:127 (-) Transcript_85719:202-582(-)|eukprot:CAMPEP_0169107832 /NCGR_PEP_ID=MMETSP1015-20121227/25101_1 /TAXON_ID=342587 /ORGANISM="Karlodinium micrum, Strain CCMP2283" /LENGTH=126 /DNA_ID=CAMNT_0009169407 /DNA_START=54 /DNA_END=434 /DNA_ORIENTATION=+